MTFLLDANVLIALTLQVHENHQRSVDWFAGIDQFAGCPIVEGGLVCFVLRLGDSPETAHSLLRRVLGHGSCEFWADDIRYAQVEMSDIRGHRQVTDVYLAALAAAHGGLLATFDEGIADLRPAETFLVPDQMTSER